MSVVTPTILSQGKPMDPAYSLVSLDISKEVNRIPHARLLLLDGDVAEQEFAISNTAFFEPGKEIEIKLRYEGEKDISVFKGVVVRHATEADERAGSFLRVEAKDTAVKLTSPRKSNVFTKQADHEAIGRIIQAAGLAKGTLEPTEPKHAELVQYYSTDWDFILSRADIHGLVVVAEDGKISLEKIAAERAAEHEFEYGISEIYNFEVEVDASQQYSAIESIAWDAKNQKLTPPSKGRELELAQGDLDGSQLAKTIGFDTYSLSHPAALATKELQAWADARLAQNRLAMIRGRFCVPGSGSIKPLDVMQIKGIGKRFNGKTVVTGIRQRLGPNGWQTDVQFGLSPEWFCKQEGIQDTPAAGLLPPISGLQIGVVDKFEEDPDKEFRAKVILPAIDEKNGAVWARLASPDAGRGRGYFFRPEPGDEVVVAFLNNDPRQPVILGAMFGSKNSPPQELANLSEKNVHKAIVTKSGTTIGFADNEKASVFIQTADNNKILLDDQERTVKLSDQHGNSITMDQGGIVISSARDITIRASGSVDIEGVKVDVK